MPDVDVLAHFTAGRMRTTAVALGTAAIVTAANASQGAYFSQSWGWVALAFLIPTSLVLILDRATLPGRLRGAFAALMCALATWIALSSVWSISSSGSIREAERMLAYVGLALALAIVLRRGDGRAVVGGVLAGIALISIYALATRLFPDRFDTHGDAISSYRLAQPLGYWNALGLLAAMGLLVALGIIAQSRSARYAVLSGSLLPILIATLYFTFSRGAWAALALGFSGMTVVDPRRLRLLWTTLAVAPAAVACVAYASRQEALTTEDAPARDAVTQGHRVAVVVAVLVICSGLLAWGARRLACRWPASSAARRRLDVGLVVLVVVTALTGLVAVGGPSRGFSELRQRFDAAPVTTANLNSRLFSISGTGRSESIHVAWDVAREHPVLGRGAGSFEYVWYERRPNQVVIRDAHSLYVETFAEIGAVGLLLLTALLSMPLLTAFRARRSRLTAAGIGAYIAWAAATAFDWHWEMVGVTSAALLAGGAVLLQSERPRRVPLGTAARVCVCAVAVALSLASVVTLVGNQALFAGQEALARGDAAAAAKHARRARALLFWSHEPDIVLGDSEAVLGDRRTALDAYRDAVATDPANWSAWLRLAQVARGAERAAAYARVHELNPLEKDLPGDSARAPG